MKPSPSCKESMRRCMEQHSFAYAHLYNDEKAMDMHIHDCYEIYYSISGGKQFLIDNCFYDIMDGDIFLINQFESHYLTQIDKQKHERIIISIDPEFLSRLSTETTDLSRCFHFRDTEMPHRMHLTPEEQNRFMYFIHKLPDNSGLGEDILDHALFLELMVFLNRAFEIRCQRNAAAEKDGRNNEARTAEGEAGSRCIGDNSAGYSSAGNSGAESSRNKGAGSGAAGTGPAGKSGSGQRTSSGSSAFPHSGSYHTQVDEILSYINTHIQDDLSLDRLSPHFYLSTSYICRIFKAATGTTINKYITAKRITLSKSLLSQGYSVNEACETCGFNDYSNYLKAFTRAVGVSPKKYAQFNS